MDLRVAADSEEYNLDKIMYDLCENISYISPIIQQSKKLKHRSSCPFAFCT